MEAAMHALRRRAVEDHKGGSNRLEKRHVDANDSFPEVAQVPRVSFSGTFSDPNFALSHCSLSFPESSSDPISSSAKPGQSHMCTKLPIHHQRDARHKDFLLGPNHLTFRPLEPDHVGFSPALTGHTHRGSGRFQSIPALLPPLEDTDIRPPDQPRDLITPTPKILHDRTGYFGQDALEKLKQNRPVRSGRGSTAPTPSVRRMAARHDIAAQDAAVVDHPGNIQGTNNTEIGFVADLRSLCRRWMPCSRFSCTEVPGYPIIYNTELLRSSH
jgi:hypothetical protein